MKYKKLGKSGALVSAIGQGCMGVGGEFSKDSSRDNDQIKALRAGIDLGMTLIDTAEAYGNGHSEELVGRAVSDCRNEVFIATKFSPEHNGHDDVLRAAEASLRRLKVDVIDLYQVHWPNPAVAVGETMRAMDQLVKDGKVRHVGVSNFSVSDMRAARLAVPALDLVSNQVEYSLFDRSIELSVLPYCRAEGMMVMAYSPLDKGRLTAGDQVLRDVGARYGMTSAQIALSWLVDKPDVLAIPKATNPVHLRENAAAADFSLSKEDIDRIDAVFSSHSKLVSVDEISVSAHGERNTKVYQTLEQARRNDLNFVPSPSELANDILKGEPIKPVRLVPAADGPQKYDLIEGRIRYWAWVMAYDGKRPIPSLIRQAR